MTNETLEKLSEALSRTRTAAAAIRDAHSVACYADPLVALLLEDLIGDARKIAQRLGAIAEAADR